MQQLPVCTLSSVHFNGVLGDVKTSAGADISIVRSGVFDQRMAGKKTDLIESAALIRCRGIIIISLFDIGKIENIEMTYFLLDTCW